MARMKLPPGFRFHPTDIELVGYYLKRKVYGRAIEFDIVAEVDIYKWEPWDLPEKSLIGSTDPEWYFFSARDKKYANSSRTNRATEAGYWKATGKDRTIKTSNVVGMKKTLVFYKGRAPHGGRTDWVMHEYRLEDESGREKLQDAFVLCRVFKKNGIGPNHPPSSATIDFEEETGAITTDDNLVPDEKPPVLEVTPLSVDTSLKEKDKIPPEVEDDRGVMDESLLSGAPSIPFRTPEDSENGINMFNAWPLKGSDRFLDEHSTVKDSTSELGSLDNLMTAGESASPITAQDIALWLETPTPVRDSNISAAFSGSQMGAYLDFYSSEEAEMLDELYRSTLQSQEFELADQHLSACCSKSKHAMETPIFSKTGSEDTHDNSVVDGMFKDEFSALSEQFFDESQVSSSRPANGSEDVSEEEMLEELMQLVNHSQEGQLPQVEGIQSQGGGVAGGAEDDLFFDILQDPNTDEWMQTGPWNEASTSYDILEDCLEPVNNHMEDWLTETWASPSDLPSLSESLPEPLGSGLRVNLISSTRPHTPPLQDSSSKPSKLLSRFARLLDSVPVLPASAAEFPPPHVTHQIVESKGGSISNSGKVYGSVQSTSSNFHFRVLTVKCSFGFLFGFWKSSPQPSNQKISVESSVPSPNTPVNDLPLSGYPSKGCSFRHGNGCYSLVFFLGALSALCWFLLLRIAWRFASHMGSLLL